MKYRDFRSKKVSLSTALSIFIILELLMYALINSYWESPAKEGLGVGLFLDAVIVLFSAFNIVLFLVYLVRMILRKSHFNPMPIIIGLLCLWLGMLLFK